MAGASLTTPQQQQVQTTPVSFAPVIGAPAKVASKMNELLVASAGQKNIRVVGPKESEYTIRGYLVAAADPKGTKLSYIWDITDKGGKRAKRLQGEELIEGKKGGDPWALVDDAAMQRVAARTAEEIVAWMPVGSPGAAPVATASTAGTQQTSERPAEQAGAAGSNVLAAVQTQPPVTQASVTPAAVGPAVAVVPPVTGAPGDGESSLTAAMRRHLETAGITVADASNDPSAFTVRGSVQLGAADSGQQPITIRWLVVDPSGNTMEKAVVQRNKVPAGSLDGSWGQIADMAAGEAARSVAKLIKPTS